MGIPVDLEPDQTLPTDPDGWWSMLTLTVEGAGDVDYALADNPRGRANINRLATRYKRAGIICGHAVTHLRSDSCGEPKLCGEKPYLVLAGSLARAEGRDRVAAECMARLAEL